MCLRVSVCHNEKTYMWRWKNPKYGCVHKCSRVCERMGECGSIILPCVYLCKLLTMDLSTVWQFRIAYTWFACMPDGLDLHSLYRHVEWFRLAEHLAVTVQLTKWRCNLCIFELNINTIVHFFFFLMNLGITILVDALILFLIYWKYSFTSRECSICFTVFQSNSFFSLSVPSVVFPGINFKSGMQMRRKKGGVGGRRLVMEIRHDEEKSPHEYWNLSMLSLPLPLPPPPQKNERI